MVKGISNIVILCFALLTQVANASDVVVVSSYHHANSWTNKCLTGIYGVLSPDYQLATFYLDTKRLPKAQHQQQALKALDFIEQQQPKLVMLGDDNAIRLLEPTLIARNIPVVYYGLNNNPREVFDDSRQLLLHSVGVLERRQLEPVARLIQSIVPATNNRILIIMDNSATTEANLNYVYGGKQQITWGTMRVDIKVFDRYQDWQVAVKHAPEQYDAIIVQNYFTLKGKDARVIPENEVIRWMSQHSKVPVFSSSIASVGPGKLVGAIAINSENHGATAALMAKQILNGETPPPYKNSELTEYYFSKAELDRYQLSLPPALAKKASFN
ncbi:ABC transporter substrate-binding protein [Neiella marina]|uniref:ABC transporter substrate-binding protein n=1 Tax=Neiella holothuriorum TaxID=2870530 RepID=A0ABS7ED34_9GAMM|nr:ABC transporter substrate-binding protein [Neiella holothuriorum]MBW8190249.1 ABC transporter substrate-binding protein [Neiella holothuriorum]